VLIKILTESLMRFDIESPEQNQAQALFFVRPQQSKFTCVSVYT